ncbi:ankyrin repeat domain-containing protein 50-like [Saccostrea cucullata]|uniref:ankyrin repeat domain-containing protein 50-like n=1 Tax=Saccostrea cuccullata TaxID=36930 RepID=UPI002ED08583
MALSTLNIHPSTTGLTKSTTSIVSPEETNFLRFVNLVLKRAPKAVRVYFDTVHPPCNLATDLASERPTLTNLRARKIINQVQWNTLFGVNQLLSIHFDVTLLICLLRNMSPSTPAPAGGFDVLPNSSDVSTGADLARMKYYRNKVAHSADARMVTNELNTSWADIEEYLLRNGASANYQNHEGISTLHEACQRNDLKLIQVLLSYGADVNKKDNEVKYLVENGGNINAIDLNGSTPLLLACLIGYIELVKILVQSGANVNIADNNGSTLLHTALKQRHQDIISLLIFYGSNVNARDSNHFTPLIVCAWKNEKKFFDELLKIGADIHVESNEGLSALTMAIKSGHYDIADDLLKRDAYLHENNYRNGEGQTLLHMATLDNKKEWVDCLLNLTESLEVLDSKGHSAYLYAIKNGLDRICEMFEKYDMSGAARSAELQNAC